MDRGKRLSHTDALGGGKEGIIIRLCLFSLSFGIHRRRRQGPLSKLGSRRWHGCVLFGFRLGGYFDFGSRFRFGSWSSFRLSSNRLFTNSLLLDRLGCLFLFFLNPLLARHSSWIFND